MRDWFERQVLLPQKMAKEQRRDLAKVGQTPHSAATPAGIEYTHATEMELKAIAALATVRYPPGTASKRFARDIQGRKSLSNNQRAFLWGIVQRFRRQIADKSLVAEAEKQRDAHG